MISLAIQENVAFVIFAGDLYDGTWRDHNTGIFFSKEMGRLNRAGIQAIVLRGNHDAENEMTKSLVLPKNVRSFETRKAHTIKVEEWKVALHGQSFKEKETTENLVKGYPDPLPGYFNIGVLHTALEGYAEHAHYAPCTVAELHAKGYSYWALGHVHQFNQWDGPSTIVFPGNLQGRHIRERGKRGAALVTVDESGGIEVERIYPDVLRWELLTCDLSGDSTMAEVVRRISGGLESLLVSDGHVPRAVRVELVGRTRMHGELYGGVAQLRQEVLSQIAGIDNDMLWLEKVKLSTTSEVDGDALKRRGDAFSYLQALLVEAEGDQALHAAIKAELAPFISKLPHEVRADLELLKGFSGADLAGVIKEISPSLLGQITAGAES